jgi:hypothetical protein
MGVTIGGAGGGSGSVGLAHAAAKSRPRDTMRRTTQTV